jgi:hypothetical protein
MDDGQQKTPLGDLAFTDYADLLNQLSLDLKLDSNNIQPQNLVLPESTTQSNIYDTSNSIAWIGSDGKAQARIQEAYVSGQRQMVMTTDAADSKITINAGNTGLIITGGYRIEVSSNLHSAVLMNTSGGSDFARTGLGSLALMSGITGSATITGTIIGYPGLAGTFTVKNPNGATVVFLGGVSAYANAAGAVLTQYLQVDSGGQMAGTAYYFNAASDHRYTGVSVWTLGLAAGGHAVQLNVGASGSTCTYDSNDHGFLMGIEVP